MKYDRAVEAHVQCVPCVGLPRSPSGSASATNITQKTLGHRTNANLDCEDLYVVNSLKFPQIAGRL